MRVAGGRDTARSRGVLVLVEVALAMVLLAGAGLTLRSFTALARVDPGFRPEGVVAASYQLPPARYPEAAQVLGFHRRLLARVEALPGVAAAAIASSLPLEGREWTSHLVVEGRPREESGVEFHRRIVTPSYFATAGVRLVRGRVFAPWLDESAPAEVVVNEALVRRHFPDRDPLGRRVAISADEPVWRTIIGVVADEKLEGPAAPAMPEIFVPLGQELLGEYELPLRGGTLLVLARSGDPLDLVPALRGVANELDPALPLYDPRTLEGMLAEAMRRERLLMALLALFGAIALVLAAVGLYGLIAYSVAMRRQEIGIRIALGAGAMDVVRVTAARALALCGVGVVAGLGLAGAAGRALAGLLYGVRPADPASLAGAAAILCLAALAAALPPARRAARVDPMESLRVE